MMTEKICNVCQHPREEHVPYVYHYEGHSVQAEQCLLCVANETGEDDTTDAVHNFEGFEETIDRSRGNRQWLVMELDCHGFWVMTPDSVLAPTFEEAMVLAKTNNFIYEDPEMVFALVLVEVKAVVRMSSTMLTHPPKHKVKMERSPLPPTPKYMLPAPKPVLPFQTHQAKAIAVPSLAEDAYAAFLECHNDLFDGADDPTEIGGICAVCLEPGATPIEGRMMHLTCWGAFSDSLR